MKIFMIVTEGDIGGAQRHVLDVARELVRRGHSVIIGVGGVHTDLIQEAALGEPVIPTVRVKKLIRPIRPFADLCAVFEIWKLVRKIKPDIVHTHSSKAGVVGTFGARLAGARVVYTAHGFVFREHTSRIRRLFYRIIERAASWFRHHVIAVSKSDIDEARRHRVVSLNKSSVVYNGIDTARRRFLLARPEARKIISGWTGLSLGDVPLVLAVANLYPAKNIPLLLRAFEYVVRRIPAAVLVVIGEGQDRFICEKIIAEISVLKNHVFLVGKKPDAFRVLCAADVMVLSSTKEGMPYTILEAKLAGVRVVATRVGGVPEMGEGDELRLVVPHSAEMLSDAVVSALQSPAPMAKTLGEQFTVRGMVDAIEAVYKKVLSAN